MITVGFLGYGTSTEQTDYDVYTILSKLMQEHEYVLCYIDECSSLSDSCDDAQIHVQDENPDKRIDLIYVKGLCDFSYHDYLKDLSPYKKYKKRLKYSRSKICLIQTFLGDETIDFAKPLDITPEEVRYICKRWIIEHSDLVIVDLTMSNDISDEDLEYVHFLGRDIHIIA